MNISLTNACNRRCQYCFQKHYLTPKINDVPTELPLEDVLHLVKLGCKENQAIKFLGGEPLLYSSLFELVDSVKDINIWFISNISVDTSIIERMLAYDNIRWFVNSDYTDKQKDVFLTNYKLLISHNKQVGIGTTLMPGKIQSSVDRLLLLKQIYKSVKGSYEGFNIRISPMCPDSCNFTFYNYTNDIIYLFNKVRDVPEIKITFDCPINWCEVNDGLIKQFNNVDVHFRTKCTPNRMPLDFCVDYKVLFCFSCSNIFIPDWRKYSSIKDIVQELTRQWHLYWETTPLRCDYKTCGFYNKNQCSGLCISKNEVLK